MLLWDLGTAFPQGFPCSCQEDYLIHHQLPPATWPITALEVWTGFQGVDLAWRTSLVAPSRQMAHSIHPEVAGVLSIQVLSGKTNKNTAMAFHLPYLASRVWLGTAQAQMSVPRILTRFNAAASASSAGPQAVRYLPGGGWAASVDGCAGDAPVAGIGLVAPPVAREIRVLERAVTCQLPQILRIEVVYLVRT